MEIYPDPEAPEQDNDDIDSDADEHASREPLDVDALVRKARRSRQIAETDVQSILASVS